MPKGYVIITAAIRDPAAYAAYAEKAGKTLMQYGGKPLVVDDAPQAIEGRWHGSRTIVLEFESVDAARKWYHSREYQAVVGERHACSDGNAAIVAGFEMPTS